MVDQGGASTATYVDKEGSMRRVLLITEWEDVDFC